MKAFKIMVLLLSVLGYQVLAVPQEQIVKIIVTVDHPDWFYKVGENVKFMVRVLHLNHPLNDAKIRFEIGPEKLDSTKKGEMTLEFGEVTLEGGTMSNPGFLACNVYVTLYDREYNGYAIAGFEPENIAPTIEMPADFNVFWNKAQADLAKIPMDPIVTLLPDLCTANINVYHVSIQNFQVGTRLYGILCIPKKPKKYPALLVVPGAGARPYYGNVRLAEKGIITFEIGIHGIPVNLDPSLYENLMKGALHNYWFYNLDDPDRYYYKRVYVGCIRAVDFIYNLPEFDGEKLAVTGGSQGGALAVVTAALDSRVKWTCPYYPALCDLTGYLHGRAGGWPHMLDSFNYHFNVNEEKLKTAQYYDVVNFARQLKVPAYFSWGFNDNVCPPTSMYAAYNVVTSPKKLLLIQDTGHWSYPEQNDITDAWLLNKLLGDGTMQP